MFIHSSPRSFVRVVIGAREVADFASRWPCFGDVREVKAEFAPNGDLVDLDGDDGMDGAGVSALLDDARLAAATAWVAA